MPDGAARSPRRKRWILRILAFAALAPFLLLLLGNLALATPWLLGWLGHKISARCGTEATIGSASCTPWGGVFLGDLTLRQPPALQAAIDRPLMKVRGIRVIPRWERVLKGELEIAEVHIDGPRIVVAVEMLASLASSGTGVPAPADPPPALVAAAPSPQAGGDVGLWCASSACSAGRAAGILAGRLAGDLVDRHHGCRFSTAQRGGGGGAGRDHGT